MVFSIQIELQFVIFRLKKKSKFVKTNFEWIWQTLAMNVLPLIVFLWGHTM